MEYLKVLNDILILNEPETPLKCRKLVISGWDRFISKWAEVLTTELCREMNSAFWILRAIFYFQNHFYFTDPKTNSALKLRHPIFKIF